MNKWTKEKSESKKDFPIDIFFQRRCADDQQAHEKCSIALTNREMQIKITVRYHLTAIKMVIIKKSSNTKCWQGCGPKETLVCC